MCPRLSHKKKKICIQVMFPSQMLHWTLTCRSCWRISVSMISWMWGWRGSRGKRKMLMPVYQSTKQKWRVTILTGHHAMVSWKGIERDVFQQDYKGRAKIEQKNTLCWGKVDHFISEVFGHCKTRFLHRQEGTQNLYLLDVVGAGPARKKNGRCENVTKQREVFI